MKQKSDFIFFVIIGLMIIKTIVEVRLYGYVLIVNNYVGFLAWPVALVLRLSKVRYSRHSLAFLLILATFNIVNFSVWSTKLAFSIGETSTVSAEYPGINPIFLGILIIYYVINIKSINRILSTTFKGTEEDRAEEYQKEVRFYIKRFSSCKEEELKEILKNYKDYPPAAQTALSRLQEGNTHSV